MAEIVCHGCGGIMDISGIEPLTLCECSECGTGIVIPLELEYLKLEKPLGIRACFEVYEGFAQAHNLNSIIYLLKKDIPDYKQVKEAAKEDILALSTLKHLNICPIIDSGEISDRFYVVVPKMDGYSLSDYAPDSQGLLDISSVITVLQAAALGIAVAHHKEFIHHDLCDESIHIDARGNVRIKNYFISRINYDCQQNFPDIAYSTSPYYISPEKAESKVEDKRGDVFSFGVLFYHMLTGKFPFNGKTEVEIIYSRVKKKLPDKSEIFSADERRVLTSETVPYVKPPAPQDIRSDIPDELNSLIINMLAYHPVQRPKFSEILAALNLFIAKEEKRKVVHSAQKQMVTTTTKAIPVMRNLSETKKERKKSRFF